MHMARILKGMEQAHTQIRHTRFGVGLIGIFLLVVFSPHLLLAQQSAEAPLKPVADAGRTNSCLQYFTPDSVHVTLEPNLESTVSGVPLTFNGTIENTNDYPVVDGRLFVKVFRVPETGGENGPHVVDQFVARDNLNIPAQSTIPITFAWHVPSYATSGQYRLATHFIVADNFSVLGNPASDHITGETVPFAISGEQPSMTAIDRETITVNGEAYVAQAAPPVVAARDSIEVMATVANVGQVADSGATITWRLYEGEIPREEHLLTSEEKSLRIRAGERTRISFSTSRASHPQYLIVGELTWRDTKSIINIRIAREGLSERSVAFAGSDTFPITAEDEVTLFACLQQIGNAPTPDGAMVHITMRDADGRIVHEHRSAAASEQNSVVATQFVPRRGYDNFTLTTELFANGEQISDISLPYDCNLIDPESCLPAAEKRAPFALPLRFVGAGLGVLLLIGAFVLWYRERRT